MTKKAINKTIFNYHHDSYARKVVNIGCKTTDRRQTSQNPVATGSKDQGNSFHKVTKVFG